ncbi:MAG: methylmalonyl-CoA epimerase [Dehalococcoidia bacterium]|nr:MAG: methylmalonyl-CoA epimerase [Dehalococcoidia bacterium]
MIKQFYGINIAVKDLDEAVKKYSDVLGVQPVYTKPEDFAFPGLKGATLKVAGVSINLIASDNPETPIYKFVESRGEGVFLISLQVTDLEKDMKELTEKGVRFVSPEPMSYATGKVNFGHPKSLHGVQIEFIQPNE